MRSAVVCIVYLSYILNVIHGRQVGGKKLVLRGD